MRQRIGTPITGVSAVLRDLEGNPLGIPVQLSKNWHVDRSAGEYAGQWFHGISEVRLPGNSQTEMELTLAYGHWGGVAAASHAQLSLIGWGTNQRWDQSALGSWGESICFEPDQVQGKCTVTDVRPLMVTPMNGSGQWGWTNNVGGADFFRLFDTAGNRRFHQGMRTRYIRQGPCLTEVEYSGFIGNEIDHSIFVSLGRTDDLVRGTYRIRLDVKEDLDFSRLVLFQVGADTYNATREGKLAVGDMSGLVKEWKTAEEKKEGYVGEWKALEGESPWVSLHEGNPAKPGQEGAWANRGIVIRSWLGGVEATPWVGEHWSSSPRSQGATVDIVPPPEVDSLKKGDYVEAVLEHVVIPQSAVQYYGPNQSLRSALEVDGNTWKMVFREAVGNTRLVEVETGKLIRRYPDVRVDLESEAASFSVEGGLGYVPFTFLGLKQPSGYVLEIDGAVVNQAVHGNDFWQTDFDSETGEWTRSYTIPLQPGKEHQIRFFRAEQREVVGE